MNTQQTKELQYATNALSTAEQNTETKALTVAHKDIRTVVENIYKSGTDVSSVLRVEQMLNDGKANVLGNSPEAYDRMKDLTGKAGVALKQYKLMQRNPKNYVSISDASHERIGSSRGEIKAVPDGVAYDPVRSAFAQFRKELHTELTGRTIDTNPDDRQTKLTRIKATITAERLYLKEYLAARPNEKEETKQKHLGNFDRRMENLMRRIEPPQQEKQQERKRERPPEPPKRSKGLSR